MASQFPALKVSRLIYLASPYSSPKEAVQEARVQMAGRAVQWMLTNGIHTFCPILHSHNVRGKESIPYKVWIDSGLDFLSRCDALWVLCLPGWQESAGVQTEVGYARLLEKPVSFCRFENPEVVPYEPTRDELKRLSIAG